MNDERVFPELPEDGEKEAMRLIESFKTKLTKAATEVIGDLYCDVMPHIETDSWLNFQNAILDGMKEYGHTPVRTRYDFKKIRKQILEDYRAELIEDLNQDHLKEIESLKEEIVFMRSDRSSMI